MDCPYKAYFASLLQQPTVTNQLNSSLDKEITMSKNMAQRTKNDRRNIILPNKTDKEASVGDSTFVVMVMVADPASSPRQNRIHAVQRHREPQATSLVRVVHPNLLVDPPSKCCDTTHHQYGPPKPPIRMASYDSCTTDDDDEWSDDEVDPITENTKQDGWCFHKDDPVAQATEPCKIDSAHVSGERQHASSSGMGPRTSNLPNPYNNKNG